MSEGLELSTVPALSSVSVNDEILMLSGGSPHRVSVSSFDNHTLKRFKVPSEVTSGWLRLGYVNTEGCALMQLAGSWEIAVTQTALVSVNGHINGSSNINKVKNLTGIDSSVGMTKARLVKDSSTSRLYLDVYFSNKFYYISASLISAIGFSLMTPELVESLPTGTTVFESNWGG